MLPLDQNLPKEVIEQIFQKLDIESLNVCRTLGTKYKQLIDDKSDEFYPNYIHKANKARARIIEQFKQHPEICELRGKIQEKKVELLHQAEATKLGSFIAWVLHIPVLSKIARVFSCIFPSISGEIIKQITLGSAISDLQEKEKKKIGELYWYSDPRYVEYCRRRKNHPEHRAIVKDIFGSDEAFDRLPVVELGNRYEGYITMRPSELPAGFSWGVDVVGREVFFVRVVETEGENKGKQYYQAFFQRYRGGILGGVWAKSDGMFGGSGEIYAETIQALKELVKTDKYKTYQLG
jgi:hypothetical protein